MFLLFFQYALSRRLLLFLPGVRGRRRRRQKQVRRQRDGHGGGGGVHWLDEASGAYDPKLLEDVKALLKVLYLFIPMPVFWALFDQQGSRWTFQAARYILGRQKKVALFVGWVISSSPTQTG